jgi:hypothetical protein
MWSAIPCSFPRNTDEDRGYLPSGQSVLEPIAKGESDLCDYEVRKPQRTSLGVVLTPKTADVLFIFLLPSIVFWLCGGRCLLCGLVVRVPRYGTEMYCVSCEVRTEFIYVM